MLFILQKISINGSIIFRQLMTLLNFCGGKKIKKLNLNLIKLINNWVIKRVGNLVKCMGFVRKHG
jgi:hypothetical protein